jgi:colicin import membrane protein
MEKSWLVAVGIAAALALAGSSAFAQEAAQTAPKQQAQEQAGKKPKVWTDDNIDSVRTPADDFQIQQDKEQEAQQAAAKKAAAQAAAQAAAKAGPTPKTVTQADSMIAQKKSDLANQQAYLQRLQKDMNNPGNSSLEQTRLDWRLKSHSASAEQTQAQLKQLEDEKAALAKKEADEKAAASKKKDDSSDQ